MYNVYIVAFFNGVFGIHVMLNLKVASHINRVFISFEINISNWTHCRLRHIIDLMT